MLRNMAYDPLRLRIIKFFSQDILTAPEWSQPFVGNVIFSNGLEVDFIDTHFVRDVEVLSKIMWDFIFIFLIRCIHDLIESSLEPFKFASDLVLLILVHYFGSVFEC